MIHPALDKLRTQWQIFNQAPHAEAIAAGLADIPTVWSLTPLRDKSPHRNGWQREPLIPHEVIADCILRGVEQTSKKSGKNYRAFSSGYGLKTGDSSNGLTAIDIDGASANPLLERLSGGDLPETVSWTSGKAGRRQILFQVPAEIRPLLSNFNRAVITEYQDLKAAPGELLELRYNRSQSALPPSRHPETGSYKWINSPTDTAVAIAPQWVCDLLVRLANQERLESEERQQRREVQQKRQATGIVGANSLEDILEQSLARLSVEDVYSWAGHNFVKRDGKLVGCCPRHESQSGTAFQVNLGSGEWFCHGCGVGGGSVTYRYFANGGSDSPKGKDFVEIIAQLAAEAGVEMPELAQREQKEGLEAEIHAGIEARQVNQQQIENAEVDPNERLKLDLQALLKESDPIRKIRLESQIACHYQIRKSEIREALKHLQRQATTPQQSWFTFDEFFNQGSEAIEWIVPQILPRGETILLASQAKVGKTALATDIAYAVLCGGNVIGEQVGVKGKVLLISSDESASSTRRRLHLRGFDLLPERSNFRLMTRLDITNLAELETRLEDFRPDLVIIDSLTTVCLEVGISEKDPEFTKNIYRLKSLLGQYNAACILIHHENKDSQARGINQVSGSSRIPAAVWGILQLKQADPQNEQDPRRLLKLKPREGEPITLNLQLNPKDTWLTKGIWDCTGEAGDESGQKKTQGELVLNLLRPYSPKGLTYQEIDAALNIGRSLYQVLDRLEDRRLITKRRSEFNSRQWVYALPQQGTPPLPPVNQTEVVENAKTFAVQESQQFNNQFNNDSTTCQQQFNTASEVKVVEFNNDSTSSQQLVNTATKTEVVEKLLNCSNPYVAKNSTPIQQVDQQRGGEGVLSSTSKVLNSAESPIQVCDRVQKGFNPTSTLMTPPPQAEPELRAATEALQVGESVVEVYIASNWEPALLLDCPNNHPDPTRRKSGWKVRLLQSELERYVWNESELRRSP